MAKIIITNPLGWLGHPKGARVDTENVKPLKKKVKETAKSKKVATREKATL